MIKNIDMIEVIKNLTINNKIEWENSGNFNRGVLKNNQLIKFEHYFSDINCPSQTDYISIDFYGIEITINEPRDNIIELHFYIRKKINESEEKIKKEILQILNETLCNDELKGE